MIISDYIIQIDATIRTPRFKTNITR